MVCAAPSKSQSFMMHQTVSCIHVVPHLGKLATHTSSARQSKSFKRFS